MAVAFDAVGPAGGAGMNDSTAGPATWAHINSAADNAIVVGITFFTTGSSDVTAVTYGAVSLARLGQQASGGITSGGIDYWGKVGGLPTGSNTVSVSHSRTESHNCGSASYSGAGSLGTAVVANAVNVGSIASPSIASTSGGIVTGAACKGSSSGGWSVTSGTLRWFKENGSGSASDNAGMGDLPSTGGSMTITIGSTINTDDMSIVAVEVLPPAGTAKSGTDVSAASAEGVPATVGVSDVPRWVG